MDENKNHSKMRLSEQLPKHSADSETWNRLSDRLDALDAEAVYQERLQKLPVYSPDQGLWTIINQKLNRAAYFKTGVRVALSAAAGLILFFSVSKVTDYYTNSPSVPGIAIQKPSGIQPEVTNQANPAIAQKSQSQNTKPNILSSSVVNTTVSKSTGTSKSSSAKMMNTNSASPTMPTTVDFLAATNLLQPVATGNVIAVSTSADSSIAQDLALQMPDEKTPEISDQNTTIRKTSFPIQDFLHTPVDYKVTEASKGLGTATQSAQIKFFTPTDPENVSKNTNFGLAMAYLPENIYNGTDNSIFHNLDLTASYNKEKVRFNTSVGMVYNEEQFEINMSYAVKSPVTMANSFGKLDTISYNSASLRSDYTGTEKHQYFTYNLGIGRRIFSAGKFSTWINAGAGFGILLNNPDLVTATENSIKNQYNAKLTDVNTNNPVYNDVNVNFVTGIDFSYKFLNKLSLSFTPTSRWYFKPLLSKNNQATDELSMGFKTGLKFDF